MKELLLGGMAGLALGIAAQRLGLHRRDDLRCALGLLHPAMLRRLLLAAGLGTMLTALMMWLAVIDVDTVAVPPLDGGTVIGGVVFGAVLGWSGLAPATAPVVLGADRFWEGLCAVAGCAAGALLLPYAERVFPTLRGWLPASANTWFQVTLDEPFLFAGGFLGQGCIGLVIAVAALCVRRPKEEAPPEDIAPAEEPPAPEPASTAPEDVQDETFVAILPGEESVVVDTQEDPPEPEVE